MQGIDDEVWPHHAAALRYAREQGEPHPYEESLLIMNLRTARSAVAIEFIESVAGNSKAYDALWEIAHSYRPHHVRVAALEALRKIDASRPAGK